MSRSGRSQGTAGAWPADPLERAAAAAAAGLRRPMPGDTAAALDLLLAGDPDPRVRAAALGALARLPEPPADAWRRAAGDPDPSLRRRAGDLAPAFAGGAGIADGLLVLLGDADAGGGRGGGLGARRAGYGEGRAGRASGGWPTRPGRTATPW